MSASLPASYSTVLLCYLTLPDLGSVTTLTSAHIAGFIGQAEAEINARLVKSYALPLAVEVPLLTMLATDLAIYRVLTRRLYTAERLQQSPWPDRYREAQQTLVAIQDGALPLVDSSGAVVGGRTDVAELWTTTKNYVPTFWEGHAGDQGQDPNKLEDEAARRDMTLRDRLL
jgi:phage gp36-like protein